MRRLPSGSYQSASFVGDFDALSGCCLRVPVARRRSAPFILRSNIGLKGNSSSKAVRLSKSLRARMTAITVTRLPLPSWSRECSVCRDTPVSALSSAKLMFRFRRNCWRRRPIALPIAASDILGMNIVSRFLYIIFNLGTWCTKFLTLSFESSTPCRCSGWVIQRACNTSSRHQPNGACVDAGRITLALTGDAQTGNSPKFFVPGNDPAQYREGDPSRFRSALTAYYW